MTVDDLSFEGGSAVLLGSVLHQYFVAPRLDEQLRADGAVSLTRGEVMTWTPRLGARAVL